MNINKENKKEHYIIKVNKKGSNHKLYDSKNLYKCKSNYRKKVNISIPYNSNKSFSQDINNSNSIFSYNKINIKENNNNYNLEEKSEKEEKYNDYKIENYYGQKKKNKIQNEKFKLLKIDRRKNNSNNFLSNFSNKDNGYINSIKVDNIKNNKNINLSIDENDISNINKNYKTIEQPNINNYINEFQLINNYFNYGTNDKISNLNLTTSNKNIMNSSERDNNKNIFYNKSNPILYNSYGKNLNNIYKKNENNIQNNIESRRNYYFKSKLFKNNPEKIIANNSFSINNTNILNKKENYMNLDLIKNYKHIKTKNIYSKNKNNYKNIGFIINKNNLKRNKYEYNERLFDAYRGKLIQEFMRHMKNVYVKHFYKFFISVLSDLNILNNAKGIFDNKINLNRNHKLIKNQNIKIFFTEKKFPQEKEINITNRKKNNSLNLTQIKANNYKINELNFKNSDKLLNNNRLIKYFDKMRTTNNNENDNYRNSFSLYNDNIIQKNKSNSNNLKFADINTSLNNYIYKKVKLNKKNTFISFNNNNKNNKTERNNILSNLKGKIIDIDINLGKPVREINDISPFQGFFIQNYKAKNLQSSFSTKKIEKQKRKNRNKKIFSLPQKKYLEESYDIMPSIIRSYDDKVLSEHRIYENKNNFINNLINLNNSINIDTNINKNKKYLKKILVKNIVTLDKRLFIHINYFFYNINNLKISKKRFNTNLFELIRNDFFTIKGNYYIIKNKKLSNNCFFSANYSKKENIKIENKNSYKIYSPQIKKDKYLISCIKFFVKIINKIILNNTYSYFKKCIYK